MLGTLVLLGGFLYWLATTAEPTPPPVINENPDDEAGPAAMAVNVDSVNILGPTLQGQTVRIRDASVGQALSETAFMVDASQPFVAVMGPDMIAAGEPIPSGTFTLVGTLQERTDAILSAWLADGTVTPANEMIADFASQYVMITGIEYPGGGEAGAGGSGN
jgi:hypothetical protein